MNTGVGLNNYWCARCWSPFAQLSETAQKFANREAQRITAERRDFREAVEAMQRKWGIGTNNACELVVQEWVRRVGRPMCCILGDQVMVQIQRGVLDALQ